jgi:neutral ceramidase
VKLDRWIDLASAGPARGTLRIETSLPTIDVGNVKGLLAGAAEVDITPPPGMPKAGHSRNARNGNGFRTRLRARVVHLKTADASIALIAGDMHAGSALVHRLLADAVAATTDIPLNGLLLGATHTHAGPGQYHGCDFYNQWASNRPGLDPSFTDWLVHRLATAVGEAYESRRPARLAVGSTQVWGYTRNRSLAAHVENSTVTDKRQERQRVYSAINPWLHLLRVDGRDSSGGSSPLAALAVFSIHGTGISRHDPAYNADVWAYITGELADGVERATGVRPVAGAMEGTHGDMTPAVRPGMLVYPEAERVGRGIGRAAAVLHEQLEGSLADDARIIAGYREIDLRSRPVIGGIQLPEPAIGAAKLAGAVENSTPLIEHLPPFRPGFPKPRFLQRPDHGEKWVFGGHRFQSRIAPLDSFPSVLPLQLLRIGGMALVGLPFEVTVEAGRRVASALASSVGQETEVVVSSVVNDYWDYLTTPEEYSRQCYEGASNLYGPRTLAFVIEVLKDLARGGPVMEALPEREFTGLLRAYLPDSTGTGRGRAIDMPARFVEATATEDAYWEQAWTGGDVLWHEPLVRVERLEAGGWQRLADDQGWHVGVFRTDPGRYAACWYQPPLGVPDSYRFVLAANGRNAELAGAEFS